MQPIPEGKGKFRIQNSLSFKSTVHQTDTRSRDTGEEECTNILNKFVEVFYVQYKNK